MVRQSVYARDLTKRIETINQLLAGLKTQKHAGHHFTHTVTNYLDASCSQDMMVVNTTNAAHFVVPIGVITCPYQSKSVLAG